MKTIAFTACKKVFLDTFIFKNQLIKAGQAIYLFIYLFN